MERKRVFSRLKMMLCLLMTLMILTVVGGNQFLAAEATETETIADYSTDRPLLMKGKSLTKASAFANVNSLDSLKQALAGSQTEIYINQKISISEDLELPTGKLLLRGYNCCYDTMFEIQEGVTVTVKSDIDASGDQTKLYTGPVFDVAKDGKLVITSGSIYGSVSENDGGAIVNKGAVEIKGGILQGHTTTKRGGAIYNEGNLVITGGQLLDNRTMAKSSVNAGGAIYNAVSGTLHLNGGIIQGNYSLGKGGGVYNEGQLSIERGKIRSNKGQKTGNGIYSLEDVTYTGTDYVNLDEVISEKNVTVEKKDFENASSITAEKFVTAKESVNQSGGRLTCKTLEGKIKNDGHIYYNGEGTFTGAISGEGQFHTSKTLIVEAPAFANSLTVEKGNVTLSDADMENHDIIVTAGSVKGSGSGSVSVRNISLRGGTYIIENAQFVNNKAQPEDSKYLDAEKIQCSNNSKLTINCKNSAQLNGKDTFYVPIGKRVNMGQSEVNAAQIKNSSGGLITDSGKYKRSLMQESGITYIKAEPMELYQLKVLFQDADGNNQIFYENASEKVSINLRSDSGYTANAARIADSEGFQTPSSENYGGYQFTSVPKGSVTVTANFTDRAYRSVSGSIDLSKDDTIILRPQKMDIDPQGSWWTDESNYDESKYAELKNAAAGNTISIANARELAAVSKIVSLPKDGDTAKDLSGIILELTGDIDLKGYQWKPIGTDTKTFNGTFDGKKYTVKNMAIGYPNADKSLRHAGLFGYCSSNSAIKNVVMADHEIGMDVEISNSFIGGLVGYNTGTIVDCTLKNGNVEINESFSGSYFGGMVGYSTGKINKCSVLESNLKESVKTGGTGAISNVGGFAGGLSSASVITASKVEDGKVDAIDNTGGFVGYGNGKIANCYSSVDLTTAANSGGFAYITYADVKNCYSKGTISGSGVGGFASRIYGGKVENCYAACTISGSYIAGFAYFFGATLIDCYASGNLRNSSGSIVAGFINYGNSNNNYSISNCYFTGSIQNSVNASAYGFAGELSNQNVSRKFDNNYALSKIISNGNNNSSGFGDNITDQDELSNNFYYSNIGRATTNNKNEGITRILEPSQLMAGKRTTVTYTLHKEDLPGGAKVTSFRFDDNIPGAIIKNISDTSYEVTPTIDFGVLHLTGALTVSNAKLKQPEGEVPEGWDFQVSPADTTMEVSEDLLLCKVDFEKEQILAPVLDGLKKNDVSGTLDTENNMIRFNLQDGDFGNLIPFASNDLQSSVFVPERPKVPVVKCLVSADKQLLLFSTNQEHDTYTEENAILPNTNYEYSLDGGKNYQSITSTSDGKVVVPLTAGTLSSWSGITDAAQITDARLRLAATEHSFRSKAMAEEAGSEVIPPEPSEDVFQVTYYMNNATNEIYQADMSVDGKVTEPSVNPTRSGYTFDGWYLERTGQDAKPYDFSQPIHASLKLYAHWKAVTYTIKTESNMSQGVEHLVYAAAEDRDSAAVERSFHEGTQIVLEAATDAWHTFLYWKDGDQIVSIKPKYEAVVTKNQTYTACFENKEYQVNYFWNDDTEKIYQTGTTSSGIVTVPEPPVRKGYIFRGWYADTADLSGTSFDFTKPVTNDIQLYAKWEEAIYTIKTETDAEGFGKHVVYAVSEGSEQAAPQGCFKEGTRIMLEASAADTRYTFLYWKDGDQIVSEQPVYELEVTKDQTFTACFKFTKPIPETPKMPVCNSFTDSDISITIIKGQEYAIRKQGSSNYGQWQTSGKFSGLESMTTYQIITRIPENETWAASPVSQPLEVTTLKSVNSDRPGPPLLNSIDVDKASIRIASRTGEEYAIRSKGAADYGSWQTGGVFEGLQPDVTYQIVSREAEIPGVQQAGMVSQPLEVYLPQKQPDKTVTYTVTFMDGGTVLAAEAVEPGNAAKAPVIEKAGYQLTWSISFDRVTSNLIVRAVWKPNVYTVSFQPNKGKIQGSNKFNAVFGRTYGQLPKAVRSKYQFMGWYTKKSGGTKITDTTQVSILENTTYYAQWAKISLKKPNLKAVKNTSGKKAVVTWSKMPGVDGYQIEYSTVSKFTKKATKTVKVSASSSKKPSKTISRLKKGTTYYVRMKAYKKDSAGKTLYSSASKVKKVSIKK